jgi:hypothetical protein
MSSIVPPRCTVPAWRLASFVQGMPPSTARSTLKAAGPCFQRRSGRATRPGKRWDASASTWSGEVSNTTTSASGSSVTRWPVSIFPPAVSSTDSMALTIAPDPPIATGQP